MGLLARIGAIGVVTVALFALSAEQRRSAVLDSLTRYFGSAALTPTGYADMVWASEAFTLGAYGSFNPPGVLTSLGESVDGPAGNLWFAGADYSPEWPARWPLPGSGRQRSSCLRSFPCAPRPRLGTTPTPSTVPTSRSES